MTSPSELTDKATILARMASSFGALQAALDRASPEQLTAVGGWGEWTLKDLLAHLVYWQTSSLERLQVYTDGRIAEAEALAPSAESSVDQINENVYRANRERPLAEMRTLLATTYQALRTAAKSITAERYRDEALPLRAWLAGNSYEHYEEHLADIERTASQGAAGGS